jgi:peptidoglycan hydrolase-like protein with peptidoglycan-binding domain
VIQRDRNPLVCAAAEAKYQQGRLAMGTSVWWIGSVAIAVALYALPAGALDASPAVRLAQNATDAGQAAAERGQPPLADGRQASPANSREQIKKAQIELRRLDCFQGKADGKLGDQTRQAVKKFWVSAKQPVVEVNITDQLIVDLSEHGDNFCRPPRRFFGFGGRPGVNSAVLPFMPRGTLPAPGPAASETPPSPAPAR